MSVTLLCIWIACNLSAFALSITLHRPRERVRERAQLILIALTQFGRRRGGNPCATSSTINNNHNRQHGAQQLILKKKCKKRMHALLDTLLNMAKVLHRFLHFYLICKLSVKPVYTTLFSCCCWVSNSAHKCMLWFLRHSLWICLAWLSRKT